MEIGIYGLGRMGGNMVRRLVRSGEHRVVAGNRSPGPVDQAVEDGAEGAYSMEELVEKLSSPIVIFERTVEIIDSNLPATYFLQH